MSFNLNIVEKCAVELLTLSIGSDRNGEEEVSVLLGKCEASFANAIEKEQFWRDCYSFLKREGVLTTAWRGIELLPPPLQPPRKIKLKWGLAAARQEEYFEKFLKAAQNLSTILKEKEINTVILKGIGISSLYPAPQLREFCDIDIYTYMDGSPHKSARAVTDTLIRKIGIPVTKDSYKHSNFRFGGASIENHSLFLNTRRLPYTKFLNSLLANILSPQPLATSDVHRNKEEGSTGVEIPNAAFNTIFIACHAFQHFGNGMSLRHLCDWSMVIEKQGLSLLDNRITDKKFLTAIAAFTILSNRLLRTGTDPFANEVISRTVNKTDAENLAGIMAEEILRPKFSPELPDSGKIARLLYRIRRMRHHYKLMEMIFDAPLLTYLKNSALRHLPGFE